MILKLAIGLVFLLAVALVWSALRKLFFGGPFLEPGDYPKSLKEFVEQKRAEKDQ